MFEGKECKFGYLPKHLAVRADTYDRLCAHVVEIYQCNREMMVKRQMYHCNKGCCVAEISGLECLFDLGSVGDGSVDGIISNI